MQRSRLLRGTKVDRVAYRCLQQALRQCGVAYAHLLSDDSEAVLRSGPASSFLPLFTTKFDFHQHQLTVLGDAIIDRYLSAELLRYCTRRGTVLTVNAAAEVNALLHNHFALRLFAKDLQFEAMAMSPGDGFLESGQLSSPSLSFLEPEKASVRARDVAGTSHQVALLPCGQSPLGWKFSQFIGAVHQSLGAEASTQVLEHLYELQNEPNVPQSASRLLLRVLEHFPATNVAEAVLAAQGLAVHYNAKSRVLQSGTEGEEEVKASAASPTGAAFSHSTLPSATAATAGAGPSEDFAVATGFDSARTETGAITLDSLYRISQSTQSLASGPGLVSSVDAWRRRTGELVRRQLEPAPTIALASVSSTDGWLSPAERAAYERGPAFAGWVDFRAVSMYADLYGVSQPEDGRIVRRTMFKKHARDPRFYDTLSDARNGVLFDTNGESMHDYLQAFTQPHRRLFEVTMFAGSGGEMKLVGRAITSRYTTARESAARAFLGGVLRDALRLGSADGDVGTTVEQA